MHASPAQPATGNKGHGTGIYVNVCVNMWVILHEILQHCGKLTQCDPERSGAKSPVVSAQHRHGYVWGSGEMAFPQAPQQSWVLIPVSILAEIC